MTEEFEANLPAYTLSGGTLESLDDALEFRVWVHPHSQKRDDFYLKAWTLPEMMSKMAAFDFSGYDVVEPIIAVVWDKEQHNFREVLVPEEFIKLAEKKVSGGA